MPFPLTQRTFGLMFLAVVATALAFVPTRATAAADSTNFTSRATAAVLMDADTGAIFFQKNADELLPPASITKLMTVAMVLKAIKDNRLKLDTEFVMSEHAWRTGGAPSRTSAMFVPLGMGATINDLLQGMIVQSGNDAAICVAEGMFGSEEVFARRMTVEARRLGLTKSQFRNPTGLYNPEHLMTAREIAILSRHIINEYPEFYKIFSQREFLYRKHKFYNRNPLLAAEIGVDGLKTGMVKESGFNLAASAVRDGKRLIAVVMGLPSSGESASEAKRLLEWGFTNFIPFKLFDAGETVGQARVWGGESFYVPLTGSGPIMVILPRLPANPKLRAEISYEGPLKPPIKKGTQVAMLRVTSQSGTVNEVPLYTAEDIEAGSLVRRGLDALAHLAISWVPL
jgi:D-alanyl-D-alanine carboxypeptidase (penicillin-binding protein 5/6)